MLLGATRGWIHNDVKAGNIFYERIGQDGCPDSWHPTRWRWIFRSGIHFKLANTSDLGL